MPRLAEINRLKGRCDSRSREIDISTADVVGKVVEAELEAKGGTAMGAEPRSRDPIREAIYAAYRAWTETDSPTESATARILDDGLRGEEIEPPLSRSRARMVSWKEIQSYADEASDISAQVRAELGATPRSVQPSADTVRPYPAPRPPAA
jgi:hypothetical protein